MFSPRSRQILSAARSLVRHLDRWVCRSVRTTDIPLDVRQAIRTAEQVCDAGPIPECCRDLAEVAVPRLALELEGYCQNDPGRIRLDNGAPGPRFWAAVRALVRALFATSAPRIKPLVPVARLLKQGVPAAQIARSIYGHRGAGPFLRPDGTIDTSQLEQEARLAGSVVPTDWVPPWQREAIARHTRTLEDKLKQYENYLQSAERFDPTPAEQLLRKGVSLRQIESSKGIPRAELLDLASRIGLSSLDCPDLARTVDALFDDDDEWDTKRAHRSAVRALVIELFVKSGGSRGFPAIAADLRRRGHDISTAAVATTIYHWKRRSSSRSERGESMRAAGELAVAKDPT